ncbi:MAG: bifunctional 2-C-methyl-D-erythritol 4-phosphate cytidylyltransferase/2-C-methyl-D-erythritol 2,4-cyclodiphosphate synthase [Rhizobiaceae bacterium]|jgi:2-C-methyl-D-erythritol 4-phosphate cytidylyltransferase/2-C-methyl-D-erythritol 2,4-cyclodiphosphate synthase|nr:bifunctional 2-C-methyl-D-erythritol 4-phosphate cytidylyltransferase/2-C-methyl-D-erythritol 2,4-cyclodiphosphate synthase [Rhizobiaceae bacterium]
MTTGLVLVAAGRGTRAGDGPAKQYRRVGGVPVLRRSAERFATIGAISARVVVVGPDDAADARAALGDLAATFDFVTGGTTRQQSVLNGLRALAASGVERVLIHDAARPFVRVSEIEALLALPANSVATLAAPVHDSLRRMLDDGSSAAVPREGMHAVQTPQLFPFARLLASHEAAETRGDTGFTDDCGLMQAAGHTVTIVPSSPGNFKLTTPDDFAHAEAMLMTTPALPDIRVGHGYDIHTLGPGDHVTLCGVRIPHDRALEGHSDADVGLHALTDALLATIGAGDIGTHFPPSDPQWRGAASTIFLRHAGNLVRSAGGRITLADVTIVAEAPKIGPHRAAMTEAIAAALGLELTRVSIKATTNEQIGAIGRKEGICAMATATVVFDANAAGSPHV